MADDKVKFELVTPISLLLSEEADMVVVPGGDGDFGVLPGHAPLLSTVRPGTVDVWNGNTITNQIFVVGGFAEVTGDRCVVLAEEAKVVRDIDRDEVEDRIKRAQDRLLAAEAGSSTRRDGELELRAAEAMLAAVEAAERVRH